jgi:hypothetical protein
MTRRLSAVALAACAALGMAAGPAAADSLVFIRADNVWLANPDGSGQYQVTLDGTAGSPYGSPSQADDGTILAIRQPPGSRNQLWRMSQSGRLLNTPINTPAPGPAGALDARLSPNGALVAYWFATTTSDPSCPYCVNIANRALLSYPDRFTNYDEIGTPNTGGWPSWVTNDTITIGSGSATQWYYKLGMSEAEQWFALSDLRPGEILSLLDAEAAPTGDRLAVVRGDNQETILLGKMNGPPPTKPTPVDPDCEGYQNPTGKFVNPTWSSNGQLLAWQEGDGIWAGAIPADLTTCTGLPNPALIIQGATEPDLSPAAINPGARPGCGNPGNPTPCNPNCPTCNDPNCMSCQPAGDIKKKLTALLAAESKALRKLGIRKLLRRKLVRLTFTADEAGTLALRLTGSATGHASRASLVATGKRKFAAAGSQRITLKLTRPGARLLRRASGLRASLRATFTPTTGAATTATKAVRLKR